MGHPVPEQTGGGAHHADGAARLGELRRRRGLEHAAQAGVATHDRLDLAAPALDPGEHQRKSMREAGVVDEELERGLIAALEHDRAPRLRSEQGAEVVLVEAQAQRLDSQRGTMGTQVHARGLDLGHADIGGGVEDLAVEVGGVDDVVIDDRERVGATTEQAEQGGAAEAAGAEDEEVSAALQARAPLAVKYPSSEK